MPTPDTATKAHPSRSAPLCVNCRHFTDDGSCDHPAAAVDPVFGRPTEPAKYMRRANPERGAVVGVVCCGPQGLLFEPRQAVDQVIGERGPDRCQRAGLDVSPQ